MDKGTGNYILYLGFLLAVFQEGHAQSAPVKTYTLQDCIQTALQNNVDVLNSELDKESAKLQYLNSYGQKIPTLTLTGNQAFNSGYTIDPYTNQFITQNIRSNNFGLNSTVTLFNGNAINNTHTRLNSNYQASQYNQAASKNQVMLDVSQYYVNLLIAIKLHEASEARLKRALSDRSRIQIRIDANAAPKSDIYDSEVSITTEELTFNRTAGDVVKQKLLLAQRMYLKDVNFNVVIPNTDNLIRQIPDTSIETVYEKALSNLPEVKAAQSNIKTTLYAERVARGAFYPTLTLTAGLTTGYSSARTKTIRTQTGQPTPNVYIRDTSGAVYTIPGSLLGSSGFSTRSEKYPFSNQFKDNINKNINLQASIPILNRLTNKNNADIARINQLKTNNELARIRQNIYNNLAVALTDYKNSRRNYLAYIRQVASLQELNKSAETKKQLGVGSAYDVLTTSNLLNAAVANKIQQEYDVIYRKLLLDFFAGIPLSLQ